MVEFRLVVTALALLLAMFLAGVHGQRHRVGIVILGLLSIVWFTVDKLFEGELVFQIDRHQGLTTSDFVGLLGLIVTGMLWWPSRPARWRRSEVADPSRVPDPPAAAAPRPRPAAPRPAAARVSAPQASAPRVSAPQASAPRVSAPQASAQQAPPASRVDEPESSVSR